MRNRVLITVLVCLSSLLGYAQIMDESRRVDTLSFWQRMTLRTNVPDWVLGVPNIGGEFDIRKENWNRWSAGFNIRWRPAAMHSMVKPFKYNLLEVTLEGREYWRERKTTPYGYLSRHPHWWQRILSCRNMLPSHPRWIFYRGGYVSYSQYSMMFGANGRQGNAVMAGFTWGFVKPFLAWKNGMSLDWEFGFSAGAMLNSYDTFTNDDDRNVYVKTGSRDWHIAPILREIHAAVVFRLGNYPMQKKYRWRYDVDMAFRDRKDAQYDARLMRREHRFYADSVYKQMYADFRLLYDSCVTLRHMEKQRSIDNLSPKRVVATARQKKEDSLYYVSDANSKLRLRQKVDARKLREQQKKERQKVKLQEKYARQEQKSIERIEALEEKYKRKSAKL